MNTKDFFEKPSQRFINRELSWLEFNCRVLEESKNPNNPLLERVKFLSISASNLDEFFMTRVAGIKDQINNNVTKLSQDGLTPTQQLEKVLIKSTDLIQDQQQCWSLIQKQLHKAGIHIKKTNELTPSEKKWLENYFLHNLFPALSPIAIDPAHHFPFLPNLGLSVIFQIESKKNKSEPAYIVIPMPTKISRFINIGSKGKKLIILEDVIALFQSHILPDKKISATGIIQVIRDSDLDIEDDAADLVSTFESAVKKRKRGSVISIKIQTSNNPKLYDFLSSKLNIPHDNIMQMDNIVGLRDIIEIYSEDSPKLKFKPYIERFPERINDFHGDCFAAIAAKDIIVHHPYETFDVVVKFLKQAARDPDVVAIKQTLYRTSSESPIVQALIEAAEAGKAVTVVVELKARFDEESNIKWARNLERAGAQVVFGFVKLKTHAKISLIVRKENEKLKSYVHFGTGNYHPVTARTYSDLSFFTCNPQLCNDASLLFNYLTGYSLPKNFAKLIIAPTSIKKQIIEMINCEIKHAQEGRSANIWAKLNALVDGDVIDALYNASQHGVKINLVVRGICALRPGIKGLSENITVKSIVGRFLEHARIICFGDGHGLPSENAKIFISSADWMQRNFNNRIEVMVPIDNPTVHQQVMREIMGTNLKDTQQSWELSSDGTYTRLENKDNFCAHEYFIANPSLSGRGKAK